MRIKCGHVCYSFVLKDLVFILCVVVFCLCVSVYHVGARCPWRSEEGIRPPGAGVVDITVSDYTDAGI